MKRRIRNAIIPTAVLTMLAIIPQIARAQSYGLLPSVFCGSVSPNTIGAKIQTNVSGTSTPATTYVDGSSGTANQNPVPLSGNSAQIWGISGNLYRFVVQDANSVTQCTVDNLAPIGGGGGSGSANWSALLPGTNSAAGIFISSGNGWDFSLANLLKVPVAAGISLSATGSFGYDSSANKWQFFQNGAQVGFGVASSAACAANQFVNTPATVSAAASCAQPANLANGGSATNLALTTPSIGGTTITNVADSTWTVYCQVGSAGCTFTSTGILGATILPLGHTLVRMTMSSPATILTTCSPSPVVSFRDETSSTNLRNMTISNSTSFIDSGVLSTGMTGGHEFSFNVTTAGTGCTTNNINVVFTAVYE